MFFVALVAFPVLAGLVGGVTTDRKAVPWALSGLCFGLGIVGAIVMALDPDTTGRGDATAFGVIAGLGTAGLVWAGYVAGRLTRRAARTA